LLIQAISTWRRVLIGLEATLVPRFPLLPGRTIWITAARVSAAAGRVKAPRRLLLYRHRPDGTIEIGRVLQDSMDLDRHFPDEYRLPPGTP
jgi:hypothetical protein